MEQFEFIRNFPLITIIASLFSGVLCTMLEGRRARVYTLCLEAALIIMAGFILAYTVSTGEAFTYVMGEFPAPWGNEIRSGVLEALMALSFLIVLFCSVLGGWKFIRLDIEESKTGLYFGLINLMTCAMLAMVWTNDIFTGYVFLEILTLTSCGILIVREIGRTTLAAVRYMILNLLGSGLFLLGVVLLYDISGHLLMVPMRRSLEEIAASGADMMPILLSLAVITIGLGIKSGLFPFHFWMPDTYGWATPTSASILSALVSKCYIFLLFKIYYRVAGEGLMQELPLRKVIYVLGILGIIFGSVSAIRKKSINRMVAFSSAAQIGYIYMGLGIGGAAGYTAAVFHILTHAVTKSLLFLTTPCLAEVSGDSLLFKNLQGSGYRAVDAGLFFTAGSLSMIGIPIFAGFSAKLLFAVAAAEDGRMVVLFCTMIALALSSVLNAQYFLRTLIRIYTAGKGGEDIWAPAIYEMEHIGSNQTLSTPPSRPVLTEEEEKSSRRGYRIAALILVSSNLYLGLFSWSVVELIEQGIGMFG